ncbi:MAG: ABC transporter ATP-binding protein [Thermodesulfobacteriota bacterium]|nr:ABC transporter ATP-binding protein [Thermodesulfobacteriota bacterium]
MAAGNGIIIRLQQASRCYVSGDTQIRALDGVDLAVEAGSTWAVLGASGSGKSTLLNILGCLDQLTQGKYYLNDDDISALDDDQLSAMRLKSFGFIFQSFHLIPQLNLLENIELPLYYAGVEANVARQRAKYLAALMGLDDRWLHRPAQLSGGQQQRVAIARALANDPPILLADEPTGNLDSTTGGQILAVLQQLADEGKTLLMVTHDQQIAASMEQRLFMRDGQVVRIDGSHVDG